MTDLHGNVPTSPTARQSFWETGCGKHASHLPCKGCRLLVEREVCGLFKPYDVLLRRIELGEVLLRERKWVGVVKAAGEEIDGNLHLCDDIHQFARNGVVNEVSRI